MADVSSLLGRTLTKIDRTEHCGFDAIAWHCLDGTSWLMCYEPDCCASAYLDDVCGDFADLIGEPLVLAEETTSDGSRDQDRPESRTWTFYRFATVRGYVTLTWRGESNGYYSESISFVETTT